MIKKLFSLLIAIIMILTLNMSILTASATADITVKLDGVVVNFDVAPRLIGGRTMVPLRAIFEALGATVEWDNETKTVTAYNEAAIVKCTIGSNVMYVNEVAKTIDVPPMMVDSRTLVPARFIAESFNCNVDWDGNTKTVYILSSPIDYTQLEKETETDTTPTNLNTNVNKTPVLSANSTAFEKLKNIIIEEGEYSYELEGYSIYYTYEEYSFIFAYYPDDESISLYLSSEDYEMEESVIILIYDGGERTFLSTVKFSNLNEYKLYGKLSSTEKFTVTKSTTPDALKTSHEKLTNSAFGLLDIMLVRYSGLTFADFGMYYEKN